MDTARGEVVQFGDQALQVYNHAGPKDIGHFRVKHSGGEQMQFKFAKFIDDRMPGIVASLISDHESGIPGQVIHHPPLAFITPVRSYDNHNAHDKPIPVTI